MAPVTASVSESFQFGMVRGSNEYLRLLDTELEQVVLSVLVCLSLLVLVIFAPGFLLLGHELSVVSSV